MQLSKILKKEKAIQKVSKLVHVVCVPSGNTYAIQVKTISKSISPSCLLTCLLDNKIRNIKISTEGLSILGLNYFKIIRQKSLFPFL